MPFSLSARQWVLKMLGDFHPFICKLNYRFWKHDHVQPPSFDTRTGPQRMACQLAASADPISE
jgi:hypothetical protein